MTQSEFNLIVATMVLEECIKRNAVYILTGEGQPIKTLNKQEIELMAEDLLKELKDEIEL